MVRICKKCATGHYADHCQWEISLCRGVVSNLNQATKNRDSPIFEHLSRTMIDEGALLKAVRALRRHESGDIFLRVIISKPLVKEKLLVPVLLPLQVAPKISDISFVFISKDPGMKYRAILEESNIFEEVIGVSSLSKRLKAAGKTKPPFKYDIILYDSKVKNLPQILGKSFYKNGRVMPIPIKVDDKEDDKSLRKLVVKQAKAAGKCTKLALTDSTCLSMVIGTTSLPEEQITANCLSVFEHLFKRLGEEVEVRAIQIQTGQGVTLRVDSLAPAPKTNSD